MNRSDSIKEITAALIAFQGQVAPIMKRRIACDNGRDYKYASLSDVQDAVQKPLLANGLNIIQMPDGAGLTTILSHSSGEWIESYYELPVRNSTPQGLGSTITYMRRYALAAALNLCIDSDDDGASGHEPSDVKVIVAKRKSAKSTIKKIELP